MKINVIHYSPDSINETSIGELSECSNFLNTEGILWINISSASEGVNLQGIGKCFDIHPLVLEDITTKQRPKLEDHGNYIFLLLKTLGYDPKKRLTTQQISIILGGGFVISFQEGDLSIFDKVRERLNVADSILRKKHADYLAYSLMDEVVDHYFTVLERLEEEISVMDDVLLDGSDPRVLKQLHALKRTIIPVRKSVWPLREVISILEKSDSRIIKKSTKPYLRDVYDHTIQVIETVEVYRDMLSGMLEVYLSSVSNKTNDIMKVLTVISTIFIPLTFITGVYGMNFTYMPELDWAESYFVVWGIMVILGIILFAFFKNKRWI